MILTTDKMTEKQKESIRLFNERFSTEASPADLDFIYDCAMVLMNSIDRIMFHEGLEEHIKGDLIQNIKRIEQLQALTFQAAAFMIQRLIDEHPYHL